MPRLFLSYRRSDIEGAYLAHILYRDLRSRYGTASVFLDVHSREPGVPFPRRLQRTLDRADAVLVIIGPSWLEELQRRGEDDKDWVRYEIGEALKRRNLPVVPVCHVRARLPDSSQLPPDIADLVLRDGITLDPFEDFDAHLSRMIEALEHVLASGRPEGNDGAPRPAYVDWSSPALLDDNAVAALRSMTAAKPGPWVLDWQALTSVGSGAAASLAALFQSWATRPLEMYWVAGDHLLDVLEEASPTGNRDVVPAFWWARLDALRLINRADEFDETAIDYCVTLEAMPPQWSPVERACKVKTE